ncbi:hypothetical protein [Aeromonas cavernicola]|uniref:Bacteriocin immunity protein n=1 Tax=Aeromonas cavernicola TaxID=1006623 RepID=A0A2H9U1C7_9GAMM|nr:hypothetical protein [Aeromonas cavernicola]PJG57831.1 hypothetical protein CUC53_15880 [Aeromonas cavernicola]
MDKNKLRGDAKRLIENHLLGIDPDAESFIDILSDDQRSIPIRAIFKHIDTFSKKPFSSDERALVDELMYLYG